MMIGLSATDRCGDPTCDPTKEQCCAGQQQTFPPVQPTTGSTGGGGGGGTAAASPLVVGKVSTATTTGGTAIPGFIDGLKVWEYPSSALSLFPHIGDIFTAAPAAAAGYLLPPLVLVGGIFYFLSMKKGR